MVSQIRTLPLYAFEHLLIDPSLSHRFSPAKSADRYQQRRAGSFQKSIKRLSGFQAVNQRLDGDASARKHELSTEYVRIAGNDGLYSRAGLSP